MVVSFRPKSKYKLLLEYQVHYIEYKLNISIFYYAIVSSRRKISFKHLTHAIVTNRKNSN